MTYLDIRFLLLIMIMLMLLTRMTPQWRLATLCIAYLLYLFLGATLFSAIGITLLILPIIILSSKLSMIAMFLLV